MIKRETLIVGKIVSQTGRLFLFLLLTAGIGGCASIPMPKGTSKGYSTVRFIAPKTAIEADGREPALTANRMIHEAITAQMEDHGVKVVQQGEADLVVAYLLIIQDNFLTTSINQYYGYRDDGADILDRAHAKGISEKQLERFKRGALVIDLIDAKTLELVYRDYSVRAVNPRDPEEVRQTRVEDAVAETLQNFFK